MKTVESTSRTELLTNSLSKAIGLRWLLHLVGDAHCPVHATSLYSLQFPNGNKEL